ncbi:MAG: hypothetical protein ACI4OJ_10900, partial [Lachnospiraceae bacterium]
MAEDSNALADLEAMFGQDDEKTKAAERTVLTQNLEGLPAVSRNGTYTRWLITENYRKRKDWPCQLGRTSFFICIEFPEEALPRWRQL